MPDVAASAIGQHSAAGGASGKGAGVAAGAAETVHGQIFVARSGPGSEIRDVYLVDPGLAVIDVNDAFADGHRSGILVEELTVASLVQTLATGIPGINRVKILVGGRERETLAGPCGFVGFLRCFGGGADGGGVAEDRTAIWSWFLVSGCWSSSSFLFYQFLVPGSRFSVLVGC